MDPITTGLVFGLACIVVGGLSYLMGAR